MKLRIAICASVLVFSALPGRADDPWESDPEEDGPATRAHILAGQTQTGRDLQGGPAVPDEDWIWIATQARHSYAATATGASLWSHTTIVAAKLERIDSGLTVVGTGSDDELAGFRGHSVRWIAASSEMEYLRVSGPPATNQPAAAYALEFLDTTYAIPRWNNSASQATILLIQNNKPVAVTGSIYFYATNGTLLQTAPLSVPANGLQALNTGTLPALAGQSGSAHVAHTGGRGALSGKAVSLEPATGFTFDTAMTPVLP